MRRDWDFVTMADYAADTKEIVDNACATIDHFKEKERDARRGLIAAVLAAGGKITITPDDLINADRATLTFERFAHDDTIIITAKL